MAQRFAVAGDCLARPAELIKRDAEIVMGLGEFGREREGARIGGDGGVELSTAFERDAEIAVKGRIAVVDGDGAADERGRGWVVALLVRQHAEEMERVAVLRVEGDDLAIERRRLIEEPGAVEGGRLAHQRRALGAGGRRRGVGSRGEISNSSDAPRPSPWRPLL